LALPQLAHVWETHAWKSRPEGWKQVTAAGLISGDLPELIDFSKISSAPAKLNLLLLHGTFSHAASAFHHLGVTKGSDGRSFFESLKSVYDDRIFAFDHFTVSKSPEENLQMLLRKLPNRRSVFDVVTHSRGG
jgi:hypothetical protein